MKNKPERGSVTGRRRPRLVNWLLLSSKRTLNGDLTSSKECW